MNVLYDTRLPELSRWRRAQIPVIAELVGGLIAAIGPTLRFESLARILHESGWMRPDLHWGILAPVHFFGGVAASRARDGGDEYHEF